MTLQPISLDAPLDELLDYAGSKFEVKFEPVAAGDQTFDILQISNMGEYVEKIATANTGGDIELPFWARIWPASMMLSHMTMTLAQRDASVLEVGAGVGVCGLFAASRGFETVISDVNHDALVFSRINILKNGLEDRASVLAVDFSADRIGRRFDYIIGSEILYMEKTHRGLVKFLLGHLKPEKGAEVILARDFSRKALRFFKLAEKDFHVASKTVGCKSSGDEGDERYLCDIIRMAPRKVRTA